MHNQNDLNAANEFAIYLRPHYHMSPNQIMELASIISNHRLPELKSESKEEVKSPEVKPHPLDMPLPNPPDESPEPA